MKPIIKTIRSKKDYWVIEVLYRKESKPNIAAIEAGILPTNYYGCRFLPLPKLIQRNGKRLRINSSKSSFNFVVWENNHRLLYKRITEEIKKEAYEFLHKGKLDIQLTDFVICGKLIEFPCGFDYYMYHRNPVTHTMEKARITSFNKEGKLEIEQPRVLKSSKLFLFEDELPKADSLIEAEIQRLSHFKVEKT